MSDQLATLRVILVSPARQERELLRRGTVAASIPVEVLEAEDGAAAAAQMRKHDVDIVLIDSAIEGAERAALVGAAESARTRPFVIFVAATSDEAQALARAGVDGAIVRPTSLGEAVRLVERCIRARRRHRVLLVDDSQTMRNIVRKILVASRFQLDVEEAEEGVAALRQIATGKFDLVFLDYNMPGLNGVETLAAIKRQHPQLAVVIMTSTANDLLAERARKAGAAAFLKKPFYPVDIDAILHNIFGVRAVS